MSRPLPYPYTIGAKLMQFPYGWMYRNYWLFRYTAQGAAMTMCLTAYITYKMQPLKHKERLERLQKAAEGGNKHH